MFDNPGDKLKQLKQELLEVEKDNPDVENLAVTFEDTAYPEEEKDDQSVVYATEKKNRGVRVLLTLVLFLAVLAAAIWFLEWMG